MLSNKIEIKLQADHEAELHKGSPNPVCPWCMASFLGRRGGNARSAAKAKSSRENGRKGGRPKGKGVKKGTR